MKNIIYIGLFIAALFALAFTTEGADESCDKKVLTMKCKEKLGRYKYDSQKYTRIAYTNEEQQIETEIPVFIGEKYRVVFNVSGLPKPITISVYTKSEDIPKRVPLYTTKSNKNGENELVFDSPHVKRLFIDYNVPADSTNQKLSGCLMFMIGYK